MAELTARQQELLQRAQQRRTQPASGKLTSRQKELLETAKSRRRPPSWGQTLRDIPAAAGRNLADMALGIGPNAYNLVGMAVSAPLVAAGMDPSRAFQPIEQARVPDYTPQNMTGAQSAIHKGGQFALESAMFPANALTRASTMALSGAAGSMGDVAGREYGAGAELATNLLVPGGVIGAGKVMGGVVAPVYNKLSQTVEAIASKSPQLANRLARERFGKLLSDLSESEVKELAQILRTSGEVAPGVPKTTGQALTESDRGVELGRNLVRIEDEMAPLSYAIPGLKSRQEGAFVSALESQAGGTTREARKAALDEIAQRRSEVATPMLERSTARADVAGELLPQYQRDIDQLVKSRINALQQQGQLQTGAAQATASTEPRPPLGPLEQRLIADRKGPFGRQVMDTRTPPTAPLEGLTPLPEFGQYPGDTMVPNPFQPNRAGFYPVEGQPRVPGRYSPQVDRAAEMSEAADEFGQYAAEMSSVKSQVDDQVQRMALNGLRPLQARPLAQSVDSIANRPKNRPDEDIQSILNQFRQRIQAATNPDGSIGAESLAKIRAKMNEDIGNISANKPAWSDKEATGVVAELKGAIDDAIVAAGGQEWRSGLQRYGQFSREANKKMAQQGLLRTLRAENGKLRPNVFLNATGENEAKFLKSIGVDPNQTSLRELLGETNYKVIENARNHIIRESKRAGVAKDTVIPDELRTTGTRLPNPLNQTIAMTNKALDFAFQKSTGPAQRRMLELLADPKKFSEMLESISRVARVKEPRFSVPAVIAPAVMEYSDNKLAQSLEQ